MGSGFGASVSVLRLTEKGYRVTDDPTVHRYFCQMVEKF